ncbi:hypothetical protein ABGB07_20600 [Micromonosporaceae bacterium B7E4]
MPVLTATVVLVGFLCILNLILTFGVMRRLREHTDLLARRHEPTVEVGTEIAEFTASTADGEPIADDLISEETVVAFFTPGCTSCLDKLPKLVAHARTLGRERVLAVIVGTADAAAPLVTALRPVALVVVEEEGHGGPLTSAFMVRAYPTLMSVAPGRAGRLVVSASTVDLDRPAPVSA